MTQDQNGLSPIAIVGMAGRFPGADTIEQFWRNLSAGVESITVFGDQELIAAGVDRAVMSRRDYVRAGAVIKDIEWFAASFFGISPREADVMNPQHRIFLECAWEAFERAGYDPSRYAGRVGVFVGSGMNGYLLRNVYANASALQAVDPYTITTGNDKDFIPTRVSYLLDLKGPSMAINTACSSSLVAVHVACASLWSYESDMALAGGVTIQVPHHEGYTYFPGGIRSADGHCRPFDAAANGTVNGNGAGVVLLKRLDDALKDGDVIHAVIRGSAVNNDGSGKVGFMAPGIDGQADAIASAHTLAGIDPATISYVEAHGTATSLGDPIEITALAQAMNRGSKRRRSCAIGSVKSNIGHLDTAAGVAGLIKTALSLEHRELPPSLHFSSPNPRIDLAAGPFHVNATRTKWDGRGDPLRAGVSSFGIGGTNAHVVLEEAPTRPIRQGSSRPFELLPLSARTPTALDAIAQQLGDRLSDEPGIQLADVAVTLQQGRKAFEHRRFVVAENSAGAVEALRSVVPSQHAGDGRVVFMFPGQGSQHPGMGATLRASEPVFAEWIERGLAALDPPLRATLEPLLASETADATLLKQTSLAQPALFIVEHAAAQLLLSWGVKPAALIGHSLGEFVAACLAGVLSFEDALRLVAERGRLMQGMQPGSMLALDLAEDAVMPMLGDALSVAAVNAPGRCVVSGPTEAIQSLCARLQRDGIAFRELETSHAFHSSMMDDAARRFTSVVGTCAMQAASIPIISSTTGRALGPESITAEYWGRQLRNTVRFADGVERLLNHQQPATFLEVGPGRALTGFVLAHPQRKPQRHLAVQSMAHPRHESPSERHMLTALGTVWAAGGAVDWASVQRGRDVRRVILPTYPFERTRHWIDAPRDLARSSRVTSNEQWLSVPTWKRSPLPISTTSRLASGSRVAIFAPLEGDLSAIAESLAGELRSRGVVPIIVRPAGAFASDEHGYAIDPANRSDYTRLVEAINQTGSLPDRVIHCWADGNETSSFYSLIFLAQALSEKDEAWRCEVAVITQGQHVVSGSEHVSPMAALTRGPVQVLSQEYPQLRLRAIDVDEQVDPKRLLAEIARDADERDVAIRGRFRWTPAVEPLAPSSPSSVPLIRDGGVYWITGGFGGVGQHLAEHLASRYHAKVALSGRRGTSHQDLGTQHDRIASDLAAHRAALGIRSVDGHDGLEAGLNRLCAAHIALTFERAGIDIREGRRFTRASVCRAIAVRPAFERFIDFFINVLVADGIVSRDGDQFVVLRDRASVGDPSVLSAELGAAHRGFAPLIDFIGHCASHYLDALSGRMPAIEVLYPGGTSELMERMSRDTVEHDDYRAYLQAIRDLVVQRAQGDGPVRILEIGGGKGVLTGMVVPELAGLDVEYHFTDIGSAFVADMQRQVAARGLDFVHCRKLDISASAEAQGFEAGTYDLVIGADVVHATRNISETLGHLQALLRPGGTLALIEGSRPRRWTDMIWGLAEGWWLFEDVDVRSHGTPLIDGDAWERCLARAGFVSSKAFPHDEADRRTAAFSLVIGQKASLVDSGEVLSLVADVSDRAAMAAAREQILARFGRIDGVIHAAGVDDRQLAGSYDRVGSAIGLLPKVQGTLVLDEVLSATDVDVLILCSSMSAIAAGIGDVSYCAANAFLDAYAHSQSGAARRVVSINWDRWRGVGQARPFEARHEKRAGAALPGGMEPHAALAAFDRMVAYDNLTQVVVSPLVFDGTTTSEPAVTAAEPVDHAPTRDATRALLHPRPALATSHVAPRTDVERALAAIFEDVLGINGVGIDDDFGELGGDSLMAVRVVSRVRDLMGRELEVRTLFDCPTVAELATRLEPRQRGGSSIAPASRSDDAPLSLAQQRLWFLYRLEGPSATYNILAAQRLQGHLDRRALQSSVDALVARHETLRTTFDERDGVGYQVVHDPSPVTIADVSLTHLDEHARDVELARIRDEQAATAFDLGHGPLFAVTLVELAPDDHVVIMVMHHIISDGWSIGVLNEEMARLYAAAVDGRDAQLAPLPIQYRDFAWWQRESLDLDALDARIAAWRSRLADAPPLLELHPGRPRPSTRSTAGRTMPVRISPELTARLKALARESETSLFMVLLAGFDVLLQRYSGRADVLVGTQVANRDRRELERLVGFFINTIVLRTDLSGRPSFRDVLARVRETSLDAFAVQDIPFERLVDAVQPERSFSYNPIVQVMFLWQNAPMQSLDLAGLTITPIAMPTTASKFDLTLELAEREQGVDGVIEFSVDLFSDAEVGRFADQLVHILDAATAAPDKAVADLSMCDASLASDLGAPPARIESRRDNLVDAFEATVTAHPEHIAVVNGDDSLTYGELDRRSNQLARELRAMGIAAEDRVGILLPRSLGAIVSILGVLKAGGAYVPLDPQHPAERIATMLRTSDAKVVVTSTPGNERLAGVQSRVLLMDRDADRIAAHSPATLGTTVMPAQLAYVLFTSGSTGTPKGVQIEHRDVITLLGGLQSHVLGGSSERRRIALMASFVFDASVQQIFMSLCLGHTLCLTGEETRLDSDALRTFFREQQVEISDGTPSLLAILLDAQVPAGDSLALNHLVIGGEALPVDRVRALHAQDTRGRIALTNIYGPAECCVDVCAHTVGRGERFESGSVPIGMPLAGRRIRVMDRGQAQAKGVTGEIFIAGDGVGRGYIGDPAGTARRFRPAPDGERGYATGDLGVVDDRGRLQFLGRDDGQVKVRGYRIELGEIETQLRSLPHVRAAAVIARKASSDHQELVAYLVAEAAAQLTPDELREGLARSLPAYMIPSHFVRIDALPLNASGKIDRAALPAPDAGSTLQPGQRHVDPRSDKEHLIAGVWQDVLGLERVGVDANYFSVGGDSIKALQIVARLRARGYVLQIKDFFTHPTIAGIASRMTTAGARPAAQVMTSGVIPLTPIQRRFFEEHDGNYAHFCMPMLLAPAVPVDERALQRALEVVASRHESLRLRFTHRDGEWTQQFVASSPAMSLVVVDLRGKADHDRAMQAHAAALQESFDLAAGPLLKAALYRRNDGDRLFLAAHHLVVDGVSWRILLEDLAAAYEAARAGRDADLPAPSSSYQAYVSQVMYFAAGGAREERAQWRVAMPSPLRGADDAAVTRYRDLDRITVRFDRRETSRLASAHQAYATRTPELLLAALARAVRDHSGASRTAVMLEGHGRDLPGGDLDLSRTVGWFTTAYPIVIDVADGDDPGRDLKSVKEVLRAVPHGGIGYGALRYLSPDRAGIGGAPILSFNFLGEFAVGEDGPFRSARENIGPSMDPGARPPYEIELVGFIRDGQLELELLFSTRRYQGEAMRSLLERFEAHLEVLVAHALGRVRAELTPSDLDYDGFDLAGLERFFADVEERSGGTITRDLIADIRRLTPLQEGLLFHALADEGSDAYHQQISYRVRGDLDPRQIESAWNRLFERHEVLRSAIVHDAADHPVQVVLKVRRVELLTEDLRSLAPAEQARRVSAYRDTDRRRGFDLCSNPLTRVAIFRVADDCNEIVWSHHHLLLDGWSLGILQRELQALVTPSPVELTDAPHFGDYLRWLGARDQQASETFWANALAGYEQIAALPRTALAATAPQRRRHAFTLPSAIVEGLRQLATAHGVTLNSVMHALWALLLTRYNNTDDVVFGTTVSGRPADIPGIEDMVGLFINTVPVRVRAGERLRFSQLVAQVQADALAAEPHHTFPLARIQAATPLRDRLIATHVTLENYPIQKVIADNAGALRVEAAEFFEQTHYDFDMQFLPVAEGLRVQAAFNDQVYDADQIARLEAHLRAAIAAVLRNPGIELRDIDILAGDERSAGAQSRPAAVSFDTLLEGFAIQAATRPDAIAVSCGDEQLTYGELDRRSTRIARVLRTRGVGPDVLVPLYLDRAPQLIVGMLAVTKAGGAYVPIDLSYPVERIALMLQDCAAPVMLTEVARRHELPVSKRQIVCVDEAVDQADSGEPLPNNVRPDNLAYVIYTSGSTGRPKGVMIPHHNVVRLFAATAPHFNFGSSDTWTMFHSYAFDFSVWEIWGALLYGGRLVMVPFWLSRSPDEFLSLLEDQQVTVLNQTPSAFRLLVAADAERRARLSLRTVIFGGEALDVEHLRGWFARHGYARPELVNMYGITETTVHVTDRPLDADIYRYRGSLIGEPISDLDLHVLDGNLRPSPFGVEGELYVGGPGLARGYLKRPSLTAERFGPDSSGRMAGARVYRSGDLARRLDGREIDYHGRADHQVQLHGFRIELGEVEAALRALDAIADAHVEHRQDASGRQELVAYVIAHDAAPSPATMRESLKDRLPEYMIPAHFVALKEFPLTVNGKLDRRALPAPDGNRDAGARPVELPRTETEAALAAIWKEVLGVDPIGIDDNYLALGGDSIKAIQIVSRLRRDGWKLAIRDLFRTPTIAGLAPLLTRTTATAGAARIDGAAPLTAIQMRFMREHLVEPNRFNQAVSFHAPRGFDAAIVRATVDALVRHHDALRLQVTRAGDAWTQSIAPPYETSLDVIDLRGQRADGEPHAAVEDHATVLHGALDLERGPLMRTALLRMDDGDRLLMVVHHMAIDGVSWRILQEDFSTAYQQLASGSAVDLPRSDGYLSWASATVTAAATMHGQRAYWQEVDASDALRIVDANAPAENLFRDTVSEELVLDRRRTQQLLRAANAAYRTTPEDLLLSALSRALHRWRGITRVVLQLEGHGREDIADGIDISRTVGWFTSIYPFALTLRDERDLGYQIKSIKEDLRAVPHRGVGYGILRYLSAGTDHGLVAKPQISFNYLGHFAAGDADGGAFRVSPVGGAAGVNPQATRPRDLDVSALVIDEDGIVEFQFNPSRLAVADVAQLRQAFDEELTAILDHCVSIQGSELTPADLTYTALSIDELDELFE